MAVTTPQRPSGLTDYQWEQYKNRLAVSQPKPIVSTAPKVATVTTTAVKTPVTPIAPVKPVVQTVKPTASAPQKENVTLPGGTVTEVVRPKDLSDQQWQQYKDRLSGKTASDTQKRIIGLQEDQMTGKMSYDQAAENRKNEMVKSLSSNPFVTPQYLELFKQKWNAKTGQLEGVSDEELANIPRRDFNAEQQMMNELGITKEDVMKDENTRRLLFQATYSPDQLQAFGYNWAFDGGTQGGQAVGGGAVGPGGVMAGGAVGGATGPMGPGGAPAIGGVAQPPVYNPEVLRQMGFSEEQIAALGQAGGAANTAQGALAGTPKPTNSSLGVLQEALNLKSNVTNQELGTSKLFDAAGLSGYASLGQSLAQNGQQMRDKYNSFKTTVGSTAGAMVDVYNSALDGYKTAMDVYDKEVDRFTKINEAAQEHERALQLLQERSRIDRETYEWQKNIDEKYAKEAGPEYQFISETEDQPAGYFNKATGEFVPLSVGGSAYGDSSVGVSNYLGTGIIGNNSGYTYEEPVPHGTANTNVIASNPNLIDIYKNGFQKAAGANGYGGQCAYEAEQWTTLGGKNWSVGNTLQQKAASLDKFAKQGLAFYKGQDVPRVGYAVIGNDDPTYGHVWVINSITEDGKLVASEFNRAGTRTFSNNRIVDPNDKSILGFLKTEVKPDYQVKKENIAAKNIETAKKGIQNIVKGNVQGGLLDLLKAGTMIGKDFLVEGGKKALQAKDQAAAQAKIDEGIKSGLLDQNGQPYSPERMAVRSGALSDTIINSKYSDLVKAVKKGTEPQEALDAFQQDVIYGKQKAEEVATKAKSDAKYDLPMNEGQSKAVGFAISAKQAEGFLPKNGKDPSLANLNGFLSQYALNDKSLASETIGKIPDPIIRQMAQAESQWVANVLRGESGAAISMGEYISEGSRYFPRPGDTTEMLANKKAAREQKVENLLLQGGPQGAKYWQNHGYQLPASIAKQYGMEVEENESTEGFADSILSKYGLGGVGESSTGGASSILAKYNLQ